MQQAYHQVLVHLVWSTAGRQPWLDPTTEHRLAGAMVAKVADLDCQTIAIGASNDHVHLLVALHPAVAVARLVGQVKGASCHLANHGLAFAGAFRWQAGYGAFSVDRRDLEVVAAYIRAQRDHHHTHSLWPEHELPASALGPDRRLDSLASARLCRT